MKTFSPHALAVACCACLALAACGSNNASDQAINSSESSQVSSAPDASSSSSAVNASDRILLNQVGFAVAGPKVALIPPVDASSFGVINVATGAEVASGEIGAYQQWPYAAGRVAQADFSELNVPGEYVVRVPGLADSDTFIVSEEPYRELNKAVIKAYYFNRASTALEPQYAGDWARASGHPDTEVRIHPSAASAARPAESVISSPKGWYDAGDYGKYIVNSGISTYTLLAALEHYPELYAQRELNIPESGDNVPDLLDETLWNVDWMLTMQDPADGGVYHKLTTKNFVGKVMPADTHEPRYVVQKGTAATLNFAAVMATASRVLEPYDAARASEMLTAAERAWQWAGQHPNMAYTQPDDVSTGAYGDSEFSDEFAWAAAELYITTGNDAYYQAIKADAIGNQVPSWSQSLGLAWMSLATHADSLTAAADTALIQKRVTDLADTIVAAGNESAYGVSMTRPDFVWGSNGVAMNRAMMLVQAYRITGEQNYMAAAQALLDYVLGRNPTEYSFVTGFGARPPMHIHHRPSVADDVVAPVPGFLAGGPHSGQQDDCDYPSDLPAESYIDHWCSYSTNEITINWNAPLVYVTGALEAYYSVND
ncbi:glycoside hydrolase family 9 protein [Gilvimarinus agarilyticus]|uniref:glycoside hydrolase family 9 protein n=1 Tax=Gilvimarinus agarilyticus TaxID=679259 RepID=UPI0005A28192|nr:glycoside hydrolase family 9 protein [Gilvimarinus agarilyticus]